MNEREVMYRVEVRVTPYKPGFSAQPNGWDGRMGEEETIHYVQFLRPSGGLAHANYLVNEMKRKVVEALTKESPNED